MQTPKLAKTSAPAEARVAGERERGMSTVTLHIDGEPLDVPARCSVLGALLAQSIRPLRHSPNAGTPRAGYCLMGICQECIVRIDGEIRPACTAEASDGMDVRTLSASA